MQKLLIVFILGFSLSTNNAVEGLECRKGWYDGKTAHFSDTTCDHPEDECIEVLFDEHGCQFNTADNWTIKVMKGCARTCNDFVNEIEYRPYDRKFCKAANCNQCKDDFCNRKFADDNKTVCHDGFEFASGEKTIWQAQCEKCFKAIISESSNHRYTSKNVTKVVGCLRDGRTCNDVATAYSIYPGWKVTECGECQNEFCNDDKLKTTSNFTIAEQEISTTNFATTEKEKTPTTTENGPTTQQSDLCNGAGALKFAAFATPLGIIILALGILTIHLQPMS